MLSRPHLGVVPGGSPGGVLGVFGQYGGGVSPTSEDEHVAAGDVGVGWAARIVARAIPPGFYFKVAVGTLRPAVELDRRVGRDGAGEPDRVIVRRLQSQTSLLDPGHG